MIVNNELIFDLLDKKYYDQNSIGGYTIIKEKLVKTHISNNNIKHAHHDEKLKGDLAKRLNKIEGQIRGVNNMIQNNVYCDDVLNQISSIQSALSSARNLLLEAHINSCIKESIEGGDESVIKELMVTLNRMLK